jgi:hypothetical protein
MTNDPLSIGLGVMSQLSRRVTRSWLFAQLGYAGVVGVVWYFAIHRSIPDAVAAGVLWAMLISANHFGLAYYRRRRGRASG